MLSKYDAVHVEMCVTLKICQVINTTQHKI